MSLSPKLGVQLAAELSHDVALEAVHLLGRQGGAVRLEDDAEGDGLSPLGNALAGEHVEWCTADHERVPIDYALDSGRGNVRVHY